MDGLSLHYYTVPHDWNHKGSAVDFDDKTWYDTLNKTLFMDELIRRHTNIMDKYDKDNKVALIVDEWGTWYDVEPGTNPGFLYQQNTIRDALVAGINLNIFNKHCARVKMANIAQLVNVLQAVILTDGEKMIKTPTYHVFSMYKHHQDNDLLESFIENEQIGMEEDKMVCALNESVSVDKDGKLHITVCNLSIDKDQEIETVLADSGIVSAKAEIVGGEIHEHNTFDDPEKVVKRAFDVTADGGKIRFTLPAASVIHIEAAAE
ncbi:MAG: alpha-N-arabinofuranosidase, partial [Lachnospiraceae bacterium]|nr:alpha-N-arabinofuranosidase [Lachnospiraceae bacterium]